MLKQNQILDALTNKKAFQASNVFACYDEKGDYIVYSYQTVILKVVGEVVDYFDNKYYSATTSKLQNKIKQAFDL